MTKKSFNPDREFRERLGRIKAKRPTAYEGYKLLHSFEIDVSGAIHTDRELVIVCAALLEFALEDAICTHFAVRDEKVVKRLFRGDAERDAPLQSLYARGYLAFSLGVFGPRTLDSLNYIREVRNLCAHNVTQFSFDMDGMGSLRHLIPGAKRNALLFPYKPDPPLRSAFVIIVITLYLYLVDLPPDGQSFKSYLNTKSPELYS